MDFNTILFLSKVFNHSDVETTLRYIGYYESADGSMHDGNSDSVEWRKANG